MLQEAVANYVALSQILHPADWGPIALLKTLLKFQNFYHPDISTKTQLSLLSKFIDKTLQTNASRAGNRLPPQTTRELEILAFDTLRQAGRPATFPEIRYAFVIPLLVCSRVVFNVRCS